MNDSVTNNYSFDAQGVGRASVTHFNETPVVELKVSSLHLTMSKGEALMLAQALLNAAISSESDFWHDGPAPVVDHHAPKFGVVLPFRPGSTQ